MLAQVLKKPFTWRDIPLRDHLSQKREMRNKHLMMALYRKHQQQCADSSAISTPCHVEDSANSN